MLQKNRVLDENKIQLIRIREIGCPKIDAYNSHVIEYDHRKVSLLEIAIEDLFYFINSLLDIEYKPDINIKRDRAYIYEQYIGSKKENCLAIKNSTLTKEWDYKKNKISPEMISSASGKKVWWICPAGCPSYQASPSERNRGRGCPYCAGKKIWEGNSLEKLKPELLKEWNFKKNNIPPETISLSSGKKVWWICPAGCPSYQASPSERNRGRGCPYCAGKKVWEGNSLEKLKPDLIIEWDFKRNINIDPKNFTVSSGKKVWWKCLKEHPSWIATISDRTTGYGCPYCANQKVCDENSLSILYPDLSKQWHPEKNIELTPKIVTPGSNRKVWWECENGHEWQAIIKSRVNGNGCPHCNNERKVKNENKNGKQRT